MRSIYIIESYIEARRSLPPKNETSTEKKERERDIRYHSGKKYCSFDDEKKTAFELFCRVFSFIYDVERERERV